MRMGWNFKSGYESGYEMTKPELVSSIGAVRSQFFLFNV
jgi:hypothetical protein